MMGLDITALRFLSNLTRSDPLGATVMLGRQCCHVSMQQLQRYGWMGANVPSYCEDIFVQLFGSTGKVKSIDNSNYESADLVIDMNEPINVPIEKFDSFIDLGTLEHVFNLQTAFQNIFRFVRPSGKIMHVLPANGFCGHGFYQFSPELFYSIYSEENGFSDTKVFLKKASNGGSFFEVLAPKNGKRRMLYSLSPVYVCVVTQLRIVVDDINVQQSDYAFLWDSGAPPATLASRFSFFFRNRSGTLWNIPLVGRLYMLYVYVRYGLSIFNPGLKKVSFD